jgi:hypothetical protein
MVQRCAPHKTEKLCREIIRTRDYKSPSRDGRDVSGLFVENGKRPGSWH